MTLEKTDSARKVRATAVVRVEVEINGGTWSGEESFASVCEAAARTATDALLVLVNRGARVVGTPRVKFVTVEEE